MAERDVETWKNMAKGTVYVNKFSGAGNETKQEGVPSGRSVILTTQERSILNSERCYSSDADPFQNGMLSPISLASTSDDLVEKENPNHMTESDALALFKTRQYKSFEKKISAITSTALLNRMLNAATSDTDDVNATVSQMNVLEARLAELTQGSVEVTEVETVGSVGGSTGMDY